ncbi:hypothetical protein RFI_20523 [Reticulomyxa filosa]|uniref:Uncharacterized protein n=1 Tax=Reticulomyxa filosa TaxID=46433 RepID=X6MT38_RETFI|nr:hypothetical protein RFI_20523 [Reticulomyxa filosa]|eukprot:ETO16816.1 hypothetical protein RFI_20523 [Reticulomyxa filosa]
MINTRDGGFVVGYTGSYGAGGGDALLVKFTSNGELTWIRTLGKSGYDGGDSVIETNDGRLVITGWTDGCGPNLCLILAKFTSNGTLNWARIVLEANAFYGNYVIESSDGELMVTGTGSVGEIWGLLLAKFTSNGTFVWAKIGTDEAKFGQSVIECSDGGFVVTGSTEYDPI